MNAEYAALLAWRAWWNEFAAGWRALAWAWVADSDRGSRSLVPWRLCGAHGWLFLYSPRCIYCEQRDALSH